MAMSSVWNKRERKKRQSVRDERLIEKENKNSNSSFSSLQAFSIASHYKHLPLLLLS